MLIPKVPNPESVTQLRSISLCNTLYKLLTKFLVNRLKPFLLAMIHPAQSGFVPGRRATDNYILAQELLHFIHHQRRKTNLIASKIDLEKAYDKFEWSFIQYTLMFYHFPTPIIELIMACILSSSISILWNGEVSAPFWSSHSIRQGDPLSPFLFLLCLNHLSLSLDQALHTKRLSPIRVGCRPIGFNHILFADDIFLFAKANIQECTTLFNLFSSFCEVSGQIYSATKSKLFFSRNTSSETQRDISSFTNMPIVQDLGKYLGMPLLTKRKSTPAFQPLLDKIHSHIRACQGILLARQMLLTQVILESDLLSVVDAISSNSPHGDLQPIVQGILLLSSSFDFWKVKHLKRDYNKVAHELAKLARETRMSQTWTNMEPPMVHQLCQIDRAKC